MKRAIFLSVLLVSGIVHAATIDLRASSGKMKFLAIGKPAMLRIGGEGSGPEGKIAIDNKKVSGELKVDLRSLNTGIDLRDEHMKNKYLEVGSYPTATLTLNSFELAKAPAEIEGKLDGQKFTGTLAFHGISKPVEGVFDVEADGKNLNVKAKYSVKLSEFNIDIPAYAGLKVADKVDIETSFTVLK
ncbi:YceI family protein [Bdellovibrio sp.]|uniref:YceI family protein n=1 Tax=Bdellovibrio sp. TaxID=28201 RepID=UPI0039E5C0FD